MLDPFALNPAGPFQRYLAYWYASLCRTSRDVPRHTTLHNLAGAVAVVQVPIDPNGFIPSYTVATYTQRRFVVQIEGTTTVNQWLTHITSQGSIRASPWAGGVIPSQALFARTIEIGLRSFFATPPGDWTVTGHSLGGSVGALLAGTYQGPPFGIEKPKALVDFGSPKSGNGFYASAQHLPRLRVTNEADPVPLLPPTLAEGFPNIFGGRRGSSPIETDWQHWGQRLHLFYDGSNLRPPLIPDLGTASVNAYLIANWIAGRDTIQQHGMEEYCKRLRNGIPKQFPALADDPDFPGIHIVDAMNEQLNKAAGVTWDLAPIVIYSFGVDVFREPVCT